MPMYEYYCNECGAEFEKMLRFSEADQMPACPKCENPHTTKKLSKVVSFGAVSTGSVGTSSSSCGSRGGFS
jgi:putative FmdB family regulatory protein